jgi:hypothetical protein
MENATITPREAATLALDMIRDAKKSMIENGADERMVYAVCRKLSAILEIDREIVLDIMLAVKI